MGIHVFFVNLPLMKSIKRCPHLALGTSWGMFAEDGWWTAKLNLMNLFCVNQ